ncbi:MAG: alpha/beta hydrolase family protein, partial [Candidatus Dormibacteraceae bacterium]
MIDATGFVADTWELFGWRMTSNYVSAWEHAQLRDEIKEWSGWCAGWSERARRHAERGEQAAAGGRSATAASAYITAGLFYHWASFLAVGDLAQFRAALESAEASFASAAPHVEHPMEISNIPFEGTQLRGYFRRPRGASGRVPVIVLSPGADSTKEELYDLGDHILRRGIAVYCVDGPGQGLVSFDLKLRAESEGPLRAAVDHVLERDDVDPDRVALGGISYGGMFAIRAAAFDERVKAVVSMSSWYAAGGRYRQAHPVTRAALRQYMGPDPDAVQNSLTLAGVASRLRAPLLQVYGGRDASSPPEQGER